MCLEGPMCAPKVQNKRQYITFEGFLGPRHRAPSVLAGGKGPTARAFLYSFIIGDWIIGLGSLVLGPGMIGSWVLGVGSLDDY